MSILLAGRGLSSVNELSALGRLTLSLIDGGFQWFEWATNSPMARYDFGDETTLVDGIQNGLHGSELVLFPKLGIVAGPAKLMSLGLNDLRTLAVAETGDGSEVVAAQLRRVLSEHAIVTSQDLAAGNAFLKELGVSNSPVFQSVTFDAQLAILELTSTPTNDSAPNRSDPPTAGAPVVTAIQSEAARFSLEQSRTPAEFVDYFQFYLAAISKGPADQLTTSEQRSFYVTSVMQTLLPLLFSALDCPRMSGLPVPEQVASVAADWIAQGRQIGFSRLSEAVHQVARFSSYCNEKGDAAAQVVSQYLRSAQAFLSGNAVRRARLGQDGCSCCFVFESQSLSAQLLRSPGGAISLRNFHAATTTS